MTTLHIPDSKNKIVMFLCLDKQKIKYLNKDIKRYIISFLPLEYKELVIENKEELNNILKIKYLNYQFFRDYNTNVITYFKPKNILPKNILPRNTYVHMRTITGETYPIYIKTNQTWFDVKKVIFKKYNFPIEKQKIIICGMVAYNNQIVNINYINSICCVHLVMQT
jgi:hypothetical protein